MRHETETGSTFRQPLTTLSERNGTRANSFCSVAGSLISYVDIFWRATESLAGVFHCFLMFINKMTTKPATINERTISSAFRENCFILCFCLGLVSCLLFCLDCSLWRSSQVICVRILRAWVFSFPIVLHKRACRCTKHSLTGQLDS